MNFFKRAYPPNDFFSRGRKWGSGVPVLSIHIDDDLNIHISFDLHMNIDIHIIIRMSIEYSGIDIPYLR